MKLVLLALCLLTSNLFSQVVWSDGSFSGSWLLSGPLNGNDQHVVCEMQSSICSTVTAKHVFLLEYGKTERCTDCQSSYLICAAGSPNCGVPWVTKAYFEWFSTEEDALKYMEKNPDFAFEGLFQVGEVKVSVKEERVEEKQLPVYKTVKHYRLEDPNRVGQGRR